jgi:outer membrane immunogenic protein
MRRILFGAALAGMAYAATPATAADLPRGPYLTDTYGVYNWTGFYAGLNVGYDWGSVTSTGLSPKGVSGGAQAGYNWQTGSIVLGGETDVQLSGASDNAGPFKFSNPWFGTLRGRAGYALNNILFYATGGFAYGEGTAGLGGLSESHSTLGWTAGAGLEVGLTRRWSIKAEYLYVDLAAQNYAITGLSHEITTNVLRLGANFRF